MSIELVFLAFMLLVLFFMFRYLKGRKHTKPERADNEPNSQKTESTILKEISSQSENSLDRSLEETDEAINEMNPVKKLTGYYRLYEIDDYNPLTPQYDPPYGYDIREKQLATTKKLFLDFAKRSDKSEEINRWMSKNGFSDGYKVLMADKIYLEIEGKYKYLLRKEIGG